MIHNIVDIVEATIDNVLEEPSGFFALVFINTHNQQQSLRAKICFGAYNGQHQVGGVNHLKKGDLVLLCRTSSGALFVIGSLYNPAYTMQDKTAYNIKYPTIKINGETTVNGDDYGGVPKVQVVVDDHNKLIRMITSLINTINTILPASPTEPLASDISAKFKAWAASQNPTEQIVSNVENNKFKHGGN